MKAKELAKQLMKHPEAEVLFDDGVTEYTYKVRRMSGKPSHVVLTYDIEEGPFFINDKGDVVSP